MLLLPLIDVDSIGATPLHIAVCSGDEAIDLVRELLARGADPTIENVRGWNSLHQAYSVKNNEAVVRAILAKVPRSFLDTFDKAKPRAEHKRQTKAYVSGNAAESVLEVKTGMEAAVHLLRTRRKIVVLTGAGISVRSA
jgi:hypothetical protein